MKLSLFQLDCHDPHWDDALSPDSLPKLLASAKQCDLAVFPETMPFYEEKPPITHAKAVAALEEASRQVPHVAFIAGGYVKDGTETRNRAYLVRAGAVLDSYDKQIKWQGETFDPGNTIKKFTWGRFGVIPLICADAGDDLGPRKVRMMSEALAAGAGPKVPIVVCSYGGGLTTDFWHIPLDEWSRGCEAPVVICGVAGEHDTETYKDVGGVYRPFGGGGSGAFWPDGELVQHTKRGRLQLDLEKRSLVWHKLPK